MKRVRSPKRVAITAFASLVCSSIYAQGCWTNGADSTYSHSGIAETRTFTLTSYMFEHFVSGATTAEPAWELFFATLSSAVVFQSVTSSYVYCGSGSSKKYHMRYQYDIGENDFVHYPNVGGMQDNSAGRSRWWEYEDMAWVEVLPYDGGFGGGGE